MSEVIEVKDVPGLGTYSVSISSYAEAVQSAGDQTQRNFTDKIQGSHADAIQAFLSRLNTLQSQVFDQVPETLKKYSTIVSTFEGTVKGAGFTSRAKTSGDGINSVASKIETDQITEIDTTKTSLKSALDKAAEVLGVESPDVVTPTTTATTELTQSVTNRKTAHQQLDQGNTAFKSELENIKATLEVYIRVVQNAKAFASANATYLFDQIKQGHLTAENMYYTALIQNDADIEVLKIVLEDRLQDIGQINDEKVTSGGYRILGEEVLNWMEAGDFDEYDKHGKIIKKGRMNILFGALGKVPQERTQRILRGMLFAGDEHAEDVRKLQEAEYNEYGKASLDSDRMIALDNEMMRVNRYNGFIKTLIAINYGQIKVKIPSSKFHLNEADQEAIVDDDIKIWQDGKEIVVKRSGWLGSFNGSPLPSYEHSARSAETIYTSKFNTSYAGQVGSEVEKRLTDLERERQAAKVSYMKSMASGLLILGAAASNGVVPVPAVVGVASVASKLFLDRPLHAGLDALDKSGFSLFKRGAHQNSAQAGLNHNQGFAAAASAIDLMQAHAKYKVQQQILDDKEKVEFANLRNSIIGKGGWALEANGQTVMTGTENYHDFRAYKRIEELDNLGVTGYLKENGIPLKAYSEKLNDLKIDNEIKNYLLGGAPDDEKGKVSIEQMNYKQLKQLETGIHAIQDADVTDKRESIDGFESFTAYLNNAYQPSVIK